MRRIVAVATVVTLFMTLAVPVGGQARVDSLLTLSPAWTAEHRDDPFDGPSIIAFVLAEGETVSSGSAIAAGCHSGKTYVFVVWKERLYNSKQTVDFVSPPNDPWSVRTDVDNTKSTHANPRAATYLPNPERFLRRLVGHDTLLARTKPDGEPHRTLTFNIGKVEEELAPIARLCSWSF